MNSSLEIKSNIEDMSNLEIAQVLAQRMMISSYDWHKLKNNRKAQAAQQLTASLVYLLNDETEEALTRINQAQGWLNHTVNPLPCPTHGHKKTHRNMSKETLEY
ncbi:DUF6439 family protein [Cyanobacterium aponinum]|uniref:DUF6439 family protein n=1 Tax=Cyanobacterium aponinum TaxID=379064 RepID=UPI000C12D8C9|nr:DUF6439 family protein [Cyanobacterium aponinum]PHV62504.1 hypothetical protein CSQ80_10330 [Cyanobacterium aponinum IPPAS B-1201]